MHEARRLLDTLPPTSPLCWAAKVLRLTSHIVGSAAGPQPQAWVAPLDDRDARVRCLAAVFLSTLFQRGGEEAGAWHLLRQSTGAFLPADSWLDIYLLGHLEQLYRMWSAFVLGRFVGPG
jgi:hypothetical protein